MISIFDILTEKKLIPVVTIYDRETVSPVAKALIDGKLPIVEVTFRSNEAEEAIRRISQLHKELIVGAGTVINTDQAKRARDAGAKFIVSPGSSRSVVEWCLKYELPVFPGISTPSEIMKVIEYGIKVVKFFPAEAFGGLQTLAALSAPFPGIKFIPTGGITLENLLSYLQFPAVLACGGSWIASNKLIKTQNFKEITNQACNALKLAQTVFRK